MSGQNHKKAQPSDSFSSGVAGLIAVAVAFALIQGGAWSALQKYVSHRISHEKLAAMRYRGEWSLGEYRECNSLNLREEEKKPELACLGALPMDPEKLFNVSFSGDLTYDQEKPKSEVHYWLCRRNDGDPSFSCGARKNSLSESQTPSSEDQTAKPADRQLTDSELENLRKRNECEQRFYDKKIYEVDGMSIGPACKKNPNRFP
jgi:hypothetical protein